MNPVQIRIADKLKGLPDEMAALRDAGTRWLTFCSSIGVDDVVRIAHRPWVAPDNYAYRIFPPAKKSWIAKYQSLWGIRIPAAVKQVLTSVNGFDAFGFRFFGIAPSMLNGHIDRAIDQPLDLSSANKESGWRWDFKLESSLFYFSTRDWSATETVGYFLRDDRTIIAALKDGTIVKSWNRIAEFLVEELAAAEDFSCRKVPSDWWH